MRPGNWNPDNNDEEQAREYLRQLHAWEAERDRLAGVQASARADLDAAQQRVATLDGWVADLVDCLNATSTHAEQLAADDNNIATLTSTIALVDGDIADVAEAHGIATARLLAGPPTSVPLVLLPLRLETHWDAATLHVRIYPDVVSIDTHDPALTTAERTAGDRYWAVARGGQPVDADQGWAELARLAGPQRAAWIVQATDPDGQTAITRDSAWTSPIVARLLPDRFAVVALAAGEPVNYAAAGDPPRYVAWTKLVADPLPCGVLDAPGTPSWMTDLAAARDAGMAVSIPILDGVPPLDTLLVVGVATSPSVDLEVLLHHHAITAGLEILADATPSNNSSSQIRAGHSLRRDADVARALIGPEPAEPPDGSAGAQLADLLGLPRAQLARVAGADQPREPAAAAVRLLVGFAASGALRDLLGAGGQSAWSLLAPAGPAPPLRIGRQPYGVLPVTAPGRWQPRDQEAATSSPLTDWLREWGLATGPAVDIDPDAPPRHLGGGPALHVTPTDDTPLTQLLLEAASTVQWAGEGVSFAELDELVGSADGDQAPAVYLERIAATSLADLPGLAATLPPVLLAQVAVAAKQQAPTDQVAAQVDGALRLLAAVAGRPAGREDLARLLTETLDAASHRFDPWLTGAVTSRLRSLRGAPTATTAIGAFGWLTDLQPRDDAATQGHVLAPSVAHAATAAVLRSGFLSQHRQAAAAQLAQRHAEPRQTQAEVDGRPQHAPANGPQDREAHARLNAARQGVVDAPERLEQLAPLDPRSEGHLPLAVDLSSRRVRQALRTLVAVRAGQPLGAVLGYQFERDLAAAGLQRYLAAFRKLTRFHTGSALEAVEDARRDAQQQLTATQIELDQLRATAAQAAAASAQANERLAAAQAAAQETETAAAPYLALRKERDELENSTIPLLAEALAKVQANRPVPTERHHTIVVPDI